MGYQVKEIYFTFQGEGAQAGRAAVFCRFAGCNLWTGREEDRAGAKCWFCDTDFLGTDGPGGGTFRSAEELAEAIAAAWPQEIASTRMVVFTGGEPLLQLDTDLIAAVHRSGFSIAVETNGTITAPEGIDWITVSPKPNSELLQQAGNELKLVYPDGLAPEKLTALKFDHFFLSPRWTADRNELHEHIGKAYSYCQQNPRWKLTLQYHKLWGVP